MTVAALIVAAGKGTRLGAPLPKQYVAMGAGPVLRHTVQAFLDHPAVDTVQVVIAPDDRILYEAAVGDLGLPEPVDGGASRQDSVLRGLKATDVQSADLVLIHDAARPFVSARIISETVEALEKVDGVIPILPVTDSIKLVANGAVSGEVDRETLGRAQTPQGFRLKDILAAHEAASGDSLTDDASLARLHGMKVGSIVGDELNFKITTQADLERARSVVEAATKPVPEEFRTGTGFDVHRFAAGRDMIICGVSIPHELGLDGHSDADVGLHAITDAVLGALALGDIGDHFPPTEAEWRGAPSDIFLQFAAGEISRRSGRITSIDVTIICETPKIKPHRKAMRNRIAEIAEIEVHRVSVKATTTERLGFTGRREGVAAQATVTVAVPMRTI